jgi:hypothetical protein
VRPGVSWISEIRQLCQLEPSRQNMTKSPLDLADEQKWLRNGSELFAKVGRRHSAAEGVVRQHDEDEALIDDRRNERDQVIVWFYRCSLHHRVLQGELGIADGGLCQ